MIWDNFSIFRTNCAILTSYIRAEPRTCRGLSLGFCHVVWWNGESCEILLPIFHSDGREQGREEEPGLFFVLSYSDLMEKVCFSGSIISLISRCEWIKSACRLVIRVNFCVCSDYCSPVWDCLSGYLSDKLQKLQNRAARVTLLLNHLLMRAQTTFFPPSTGRGYLFAERNKKP